ncbi:MAG: ABC transporter ATP-binding protein, partial [Cyclobacteriaceae bacterium]
MQEFKTHNKQESKTNLRKVFKTIIWPRRRLLLLGLVLIIFNRLAGLVLPGASKYLIDEVVVNKDIELLKWLLVAVFSALLIQSVTSYVLTLLLSVEAQRLIAKLRSTVQKQIIHLPVRFFDSARSGELVSRIMSDVEGVRNLVGTGLVQLFGGVLTSVIALVLLLQISTKLTLYILVPLIVFGFISLKAFKYIRPIFRKRSVINAEVTGRLTESLNGIRVIKGFNAEQQEVKTFEDGVERLFLNVKQSLTTTSFVTSASTLLLGLAGVCIMGLGGYMIMQEEMSIGDFFAFTLYLGFLIAPIVQMSNIGSQITEAFAGLDRTEELMNMEKEADDDTRTETLQTLKGDISFKNVNFAYEPGKPVLNDISFEAPSGSVTALVGSSGSGKTTIAGL